MMIVVSRGPNIKNVGIFSEEVNLSALINTKSLELRFNYSFCLILSKNLKLFRVFSLFYCTLLHLMPLLPLMDRMGLGLIWLQRADLHRRDPDLTGTHTSSLRSF